MSGNRRYRALIVDDNELWLGTLVELFEQNFAEHGIALDADPCESAEKARRLLRERHESLDVLVTDIRFPPADDPHAPAEEHPRSGMDVIKAAHRYRVPLIVGYTTLGHPEWGSLEAEARGYGALFFQKGHFSGYFNASPFPRILEAFDGIFRPTVPREAGGSVRETAERAKNPRRVAVVHGANDEAREAMFMFLSAIRLEPVEWGEAVKWTGMGSPPISEVLKRLFEETQAVVVLLTPDEHVRLVDRYAGPPGDQAGLQPRPNVYVEAGMAFAVMENRTILVRLGDTREATDLAGRAAVVLDGSPGATDDLIDRLETAGCPVQRTKTRHQIDFVRTIT